MPARSNLGIRTHQPPEPVGFGGLLHSSSCSAPAFCRRAEVIVIIRCFLFGCVLLMMSSSVTHPIQFPPSNSQPYLDGSGRPARLWSAGLLFPGKRWHTSDYDPRKRGIYMVAISSRHHLYKVTRRIQPHKSHFPRLLQRNLHARQLLDMLFLAALQQTSPVQSERLDEISKRLICRSYQKAL